MQLTHKSIVIHERSTIAEARRVALQAAQSLGFDEQRRSDIGIVATEAATNVLLHGKGGELLVCPFVEGRSIWLDLLALDSGTGISDLGRAIEDGFSTAGTAGQGMGAIARLSDASSFHSLPEKGTACWSRFVAGKAPATSNVGVVSIPVPGEASCGDSFAIHLGPSRSLYMVVDGLGHGAGATEAAEEAVNVVKTFSSESLTEILARSHDALKKTRGAAMSLVAINHDRGTVSFAGIGNVSAVLVTGTQSRGLTFQNGTLGASMPRVPQEYTCPAHSNSMLVMYSDGLNTRLTIGGYVGLRNRHPALLAGLLYRDFGRKRDDATVLVAPVGEGAA